MATNQAGPTGPGAAQGATSAGRDENVSTAITSQPQPTSSIPGSSEPQNFSKKKEKQSIRKIAEVDVILCKSTGGEKNLQLKFDEEDKCFWNYILDRPGTSGTFSNRLHKKGLLVKHLKVRPSHCIEIYIETEKTEKHMEIELRAVVLELSKEMNIKMHSLEIKDEKSLHVMYKRCIENFPKVLIMQAEKNLKLYVVGTESEVSSAEVKFSAPVTGVTQPEKKETKRLSKELDVTKANILRCFHIAKKLKEAYPEVKLLLDDQNHIHVEGPADDCESVINNCCKEIDTIFQNGEKIYEFSDEEILFLNKRGVMKYVRSQITEEHLLSISESDGTLEISLFCEKKKRETILKAIKQSIDFIDALLIEDIYLFSDETFIKKLEELFGEKFEFLPNRSIMVTSNIKKNLMKHLENCMNSMIETITIDVPSEEIGKFCRKFHLKHLQKDHRVRVEENNGKWIVKGTMGATRTFVTDFNQKIGLLKTCKHTLNEFQFENVTENLLAEIEKNYECSILLKENDVSDKLQKETGNQKIPQKCWKIQDGFTVSVIQQHVEDVQSGLLVKVGSQNLVQQEMTREKFGCKLYAIGQGRLETQMNVPYWKDGQRKECDIVQNFAKNILEMKGIDMVSFPLNLNASCGMPQKKFIKSVLQAFNDLKDQNQSPEIQQVVFCHPNKKDYEEAAKILNDKMRSLKAVQIPTTVSFKSTNKRLRVEIVKGNIAKSRCDIIVNTTSKDLDLQHGGVSANILKAAGGSLQRECYEKYPDGILYGGVAVTRGHSLPCKYILHGALQTFSKEKLETFERFIVRCMEEACKVSAKSIAFPALGTGNLKYPQKWVAETMFNTVYTFWSTRKNCSVELVEFCLYEKDYLTVKAFENEELKWHWPQLEEENSHDEGMEFSSGGRFLLLCTSESEKENKKAVDQILEKIGGARSKTSQSNDKPELPKKRRAPQPPEKSHEQSHHEKKNETNFHGPETAADIRRNGMNNSQRDLISGNEKDYESKRLVVRIKDPNLIQGGENAVKTEFQRQILEERKVELIVYPFNSAEHLLVVCLCKEDADCVLKKSVEKKMAFEIQKLMAEAVVNVEANMSSQVVAVLTSRGYKLSDIAKHSGVTVKENNILCGSLQEIKAAQHFLIQVCKKQSKSVENKKIERQNSTYENCMNSKSPPESPELDKVSPTNKNENLLEKQEQKPEQKKKISELEEEEIDAEKETWPEFECRKWEFYALNFLLPKVVQSSSVREKENGKFGIQGSKETISELDEQLLNIRKMRRKELSPEEGARLEEQYGIPWIDKKTRGMLLKDEGNAFLLCSGIREMKELDKILEIEKAQVSKTVDLKMKSQSFRFSDRQKTLVMKLENGIEVFVYTAMLDDVCTQSIVLESEMQASEVTPYSSHMFSIIGGRAAADCKKSGQKLKETEAFLSLVDELKNCKTMIHFVNPKKEKSVDNMRQKIIAAVQNCLWKAEEAGLSSIAFPPICTGLCSLKICSQCYVDALLHYMNSSKVLMEIHFVDSNVNNVNVIKQAFEDQAIALASSRVRQPSPPQQNVICKVIVYPGDILKSTVEAICCCEYLDAKNNYTHGRLSLKILDYFKKSGIKYDIPIPKKRTLKIGDTVIKNNSNWFDVIHLWMPITQSATSMTGNIKEQYFKQYHYCIHQMLQAADDYGYPSIAFTFFGAGVHAKNDAVLNGCAEAMMDCVQNFIPITRHLRQIHIVQRDKKQCEILEKYFSYTV